MGIIWMDTMLIKRCVGVKVGEGGIIRGGSIRFCVTYRVGSDRLPVFT